MTSDLYCLLVFGSDLPRDPLLCSDVGVDVTIETSSIDSSEEKCGLFTNKKFGISFFFDLFHLAVLFKVSVMVPVILSFMDWCCFLVFFLDGFFTDITPVTSSSSEIMKPFPTSEEKYINVFFPGSPLNNEVLITFIKQRITKNT